MALLKSLLQHFSFKSTAGLIFLVLFSLLWETKPAKAQLQELDINPISVDGAIPVFRSHPDMAAIIIRSSLSNLTFSSNLEIIEERSDPAGGEYILIIEPVTQTIRIDTPGFLAGRIPVRGLSARQVVYYSVEPAAQEADDTIPVVIRVNPVDARVEYNGELLDLSRSVPFEAGSHTLTLSREHYHSRTETIEVSPDNTFFEFQMEPLREHLLRIRSEPAGAMVYIDGVEQGATDRAGVLELFQFPGTYHIEIMLSGHERTEQTIEVSDDADNTFLFFLERNAGMLSIQVEPQNATVTVNRRQVDVSQPLELAPGTYRLEAEQQGYESFSETLTVERGQQLERTITLQPHTGSLLFQVSPSFAQSTLRDNNNNIIEEWSGSRRIDDLLVGEWMITVNAEGYRPEEKEIEIMRYQTAQVSVSLTETIVEHAEANQLPAGFRCGHPITFIYAGKQVTYGTVLSANNRCWLDRNLGAKRVARSPSDSESFGDLFQWGRGDDGHQVRNSPLTTTLSVNKTPEHNFFIIARNNPHNWLNLPDDSLWSYNTNNPCPQNFRLPTEEEWSEEFHSWNVKNSMGAFASRLKLPSAGQRLEESGVIRNASSRGRGYYWSNAINQLNSISLIFTSNSVEIKSEKRASGFSVRCIND